MLKKTGLLAAALALSVMSLWPQYQGRIEGRVVDAEGRPLAGVEVMIVSQKMSSQRFELKSDKEGRFVQIGLAPGYYQVTLSKPSFAGRSLEIKVNIAESAQFEVKLEAAASDAARTMSEADQLFLKGNELFAAEKYGEAIASYEEAIRLNSSQWAYYFNLGLVHKKTGRGEEARAAFSKARELNPDGYGPNKELAESLAKAGKYEEAKKLYLKALEISADEPDVFYNLGLCQVSTGEGEAALASFQKCLELKPDYAEAYYELGTLYIGRNKVKEAIESLEKFLQLAPEHEKAGLARQLLEFLKKQ